MTHGSDAAVAIVGLACRLPGADTPAAFWANLAGGRESITRFGPSGPPGEAPAVAGGGERPPAAGLIEGTEQLDLAVFEMSWLDATLTCPQHRLLLECAYEALDAAGCDPRRFPGAIGIYAGGSETGYLAHLRAHRDQLLGASDAQLRLATGLDVLTARVAYQLGLRGPAVTVQAAGATSLVAIHVAAQALLAGDCDLALAGGATVHAPTELGRSSREAIASPDGRCRAFDAGAQGTVDSDGVVVIALKRLGDALGDRDHIHAVLLGSAINSDAGGKRGFTTPSIEGQVRAIRAAHAAAGVEPDTIGFIEGHGDASPLGDPIEIAALRRAFAGRRTSCYLGSVKTNVGHTGAAAGAAGLLKAVLALEHRLVPGTLHFTAPSPRFALELGPFVVNPELRPWPAGRAPRRAGVSSFGIGGSHAHAVLEEAPGLAATPPAGPQLLVVSARSLAALDRGTAALAAHLTGAANRVLQLADVAWTLQVGRQQHPLRRFAVCASLAEAGVALGDLVHTPPVAAGEAAPRVVFMFPGQGGHSVGMARGLYRTQRVFRDAIDRCSRIAAPVLGLELRAVLDPPDDAEARAAAARRLSDLEVAQVAVFAVEIALAELWRHWGVVPDAVLGHSLGAYAAATTAGVIALDAALALVIARARLLARLPPGAMLAVSLSEAALAARLGDGLAISAINGPSQCAVSGAPDAIAELHRALAADGVNARVLRVPRPAHSPALDPLLGELEACVRAIALSPPRLPWISDMTGTWVSAEDATDPRYFTQHLRRPVRFGDALATAFDGPRAVLIEVGPGRALTHLARQHPRVGAHVPIATLPHPTDPTPDDAAALDAIGRLWSAGAAIAWDVVHDGPRRRVPLPTYAFDRTRCAVGGPRPGGEPAAAGARGGDAPAPPPPELAPAAEQVAAIFGQVLGLAEVAAHANFFELGGDSLMAAQLAARLRAAFPGVEVRPRTVFKAPTVAALARLIAQAAPGSSSGSL